MKKFLRDLIAKKKTELKVITARFDKSTDEAEIRALGETLQALKDEITEAEEKLAELEKGGEGNEGEGTEGASGEGGTEGRSNAPINGQLVNGAIVGAFAQNTQTQRTNEPMLDTFEYRNAFANYVRTGNATELDAIVKRNADAGMVTTEDVGKIIPNTVMKEFIKKVSGVYGSIYAKVRKLNVKGGVEFPIEDLVPTVSWITETTVSGEQSAPEIKASVSFGYHIVEARIAQSLLSQVVTLEYLEQEIAVLLAEAFVKEFDRVIINGSGSGQPLGILKDTRVDGSHKIQFTAADLADWTKWRKKLFAIIPLSKRGEGVMLMTANTWESYCMTLTDANNNPLGTETFNIQNGDTICRFAGREVILVEPDILADFDTAGSGDAFAIYFKPNDYAVNSNMQLGFKRYFDENKNKWINKGLAIIDGKLLDTAGVYILTK